MIDLYNKTVDSFAEELEGFSKYFDPDFVDSKIYKFKYRWHIPTFSCRHATIKQLEATILSTSKRCNEEYLKLLKDFKFLKDKVNQNIFNFQPFISKVLYNGGHDFFTLQNVTDYNRKIYFYAYMVKDNYDETYSFYGYNSRLKEPTVLIVDPKVYEISYMTKTEFYDNYLPNRTIYSGISDESEMNNYTDKIENLFKLFGEKH